MTKILDHSLFRLDHLDHWSDAMNTGDTFNGLDHSIVTQRRDTIDENCVTIEASIVSPTPSQLTKPAKKVRQYQQKFGGFCVVCNTFFPAKTSKKKTCGDVCRSRLKRQREKAQHVQQDMLWALGDLQQMTRSDDRILRKKAKTMIAQIREQILMTCEEVGLKP
jgi:hypothetical protein